MGSALFYHLTQSPAETLVPTIIDRALATGWRVAIKSTARQRLEWLDEKLWLGPEDGFLPHGIAGGPHDADQPVLLTLDDHFPNAAACLIAVDGAQVAPAVALALDRVCILFDGNDPAAVEAARGQWRDLTGAGVPAQYWSEASGRWEKKSEKG